MLLLLKLVILLKHLLLPENIASLNESTFLHKVESARLLPVSLVQLTVQGRIEKVPFGEH